MLYTVDKYWNVIPQFRIQKMCKTIWYFNIIEKVHKYFTKKQFYHCILPSLFILEYISFLNINTLSHSKLISYIKLQDTR